MLTRPTIKCNGGKASGKTLPSNGISIGLKTENGDTLRFFGHAGKWHFIYQLIEGKHFSFSLTGDEAKQLANGMLELMGEKQ